MILVDRPIWPAHGRRFAHLVSNESFNELQRFAADLGLPPRAFHRDHYDLPDAWWDVAVGAGAGVVEPGRQRNGRRVRVGLVGHQARRLAPDLLDVFDRVVAAVRLTVAFRQGGEQSLDGGRVPVGGLGGSRSGRATRPATAAGPWSAGTRRGRTCPARDRCRTACSRRRGQGG
ncbi:DUF4031 domain-containing protein [Iamia sp.]|uniref:DUF4031 domain-containing protein n=1 Tax=Iamia sp. TaxID=2722710 RepID=UPI0032C23B7E